jgi:hypothetical protein
MSVLLKIKNYKYNRFGEQPSGSDEVEYKTPEDMLDGLNTEAPGELGHVDQAKQELQSLGDQTPWEKLSTMPTSLKVILTTLFTSALILAPNIDKIVRKSTPSNNPIPTKDIGKVSKEINSKHFGFMDKNQIEAVQIVQNQLYANNTLFFFSSSSALPGKIDYEIESTSTLEDLQKSLSKINNPKIKSITVDNSNEEGLFIITIMY